MFIRGYLRASTDDQNAERARDQLTAFAQERGMAIASWYVENASGTTVDRPELRRLLKDTQPGDILLIEAIDRLSRLPGDEWQMLRNDIESKGLRIVALDLPTSHAAMQPTQGDDFTSRMLDAINRMMLDMMAAIARKDYEQRRQRQAQGIIKAQQAGRYKGRPKDTGKRRQVAELLAAGFSVRKTARHARVSTYTVQDVKKHGI